MQIITSILEGFLGDYRNHNDSTGQISFDCPACSDEKNMVDGDGKGNLEINYFKDVYKCWVCKDTNDMYGPISKLIKKYGNQKILADYIKYKPDAIDDEYIKKVVLKLPDGFKPLIDCTYKDFKYKTAINYLSSRGIGEDKIREFNIGYTTKGRFFNRIIIPSYDMENTLNYFIARWFEKIHTKLKYLNPDGVNKSNIIFNENKINFDSTIYLVEGVTDHIVIPNSIPLLGKYVSEILFKKLYDNANANIVILLDGDAINDAKNLHNQLNIGRLKGKILICPTPERYDPSKIYELRGNTGIIALLKKSTKIEKI